MKEKIIGQTLRQDNKQLVYIAMLTNQTSGNNSTYKETRIYNFFLDCRVIMIMNNIPIYLYIYTCIFVYLYMYFVLWG